MTVSGFATVAPTAARIVSVLCATMVAGVTSFFGSLELPQAARSMVAATRDAPRARE
jgi:hypothetical protein